MAQADAVEARLVQHAAARRGCERVMVAGDTCPVEPCGQRQKPPPRLLVQSKWSLPIMEAVAKAPEFAHAGFIDQLLYRRQCRIAVIRWQRSEEHKSELQSLMRNSYSVFCLNINNRRTKSTKRHN